MDDLTMSEVRSDFGPTVERVHHRLERVRIMKHGRPMCALVPVEDLELLERFEDMLDSEAARLSLAESDERLLLDDLRKEMGL